MPLSIVIPDSSDQSQNVPNDISRTSVAPSQDSESASPSSQSQGTGSPGTSPVSVSSRVRVPVPSRKASSSSLPIYNRRPLPNPPVVRWCTSSDSPISSSSTLIDSPQEGNESTNSAANWELRAHLQTCLDENKLANRSLTMDNAVLHCVSLKGFQHHTSFQLDRSFQQLLTHATMLDFAFEESNHEALSQILQGLDRGVEEFLEGLERLPFDLRNTQSFISGTSDILQAKSALLGIAGQLTSKADDEAVHHAVKRCQYERDVLLRAIRVFFDIADLESTLQDKLVVKSDSSPEPFLKRRFRFRLSRRQSTNAQRAKLPDSPTVLNLSQPDPEHNVADEDEEQDEYNCHVAMVSDLLAPLESDEYWGVSMPCPMGDAADIVLSEEGRSLQAASLAALVYILTDPQSHTTPKCDGDLLHTFLFCFRSFCAPVELAKALISRLEEQPGSLNSSQRSAWPHYHSCVKSRVWQLINAWIDEYWIHEKDRIAGLHIKDFVSQSPEESGPEERDELVRKLDGRREAAISLAPSGDSVEEEPQPEATLSSSRRIACRQKSIRYKRKLQQRVDKHVQKVPQRTPTEDDFRSACELDDLIQSMDGAVHILQLNSRELCQELTHQLAIFMSEGYRRVIPEDLWYRHYGLGHDCDGDIARSTQQAYESALSSWVTGSILDQSAPIPRAAVMTFFIALALRSHAERNFGAMFNIYDGLTHPCLESLSEIRLPLSETSRSALERLSELKENVDTIVLDEKGIALFPRPAVPTMQWYFNSLGTAINTKPLVRSTNSLTPVANMERCFNITRIVSEMEHWHVPYTYPRADNVQAWLQKCLEGAIARNVERESNWMFKQSEAIEQSGRPEPTKQHLRLPRLSMSNRFGKKNAKIEWKEATILQLIPELEAQN